jgi:hypothetical protein
MGKSMLKKHRHRWFPAIVIMALLAYGCSDKNPDAPLFGNAHLLSWANPQFKGTETFHGSDVQANGTRECAACHGSDLNGLADVPGCRTCHFSPDGSKVPPEAEWVHGQDRHIEFEADTAVCNTCHAHERKFGVEPESCHDCHGEGTNHVLGRALLDPNSSDFHATGPMETCSSCHDVSDKCYQCHFGSSGSKAPQGSGWTHGNNTQHAGYTSNQATCNACHDLNRTYGNGPASCHDCHLHDTGQAFLDKTSATFHGDDPQAGCADCHDPVTDCSSCHFDASGSKAPQGTGWTHGNNPQHAVYTSDQATCNTCHDLNRSYGNGPESCHDCHATHDTGQAFLDKNSSTFHGDESQTGCSGCHNLVADCGSCHFGSSGSKVPDWSSWTHNGDGTQHEDFESVTNVCNACHDLNRSYGNGPKNCHDCH